MNSSPGSTTRMQIEIDDRSGFCYGVIRAIRTAESMLDEHGELWSLGEIVHNDKELERLKRKGLCVVTPDGLPQLHDKPLLIRAHGEPPATYETARRQRLSVIDCTCPVVLQLQQRIKTCYEKVKAQHGQLVIFGKRGHAEVLGLVGQVGGDALVIEHAEQLQAIDCTRPVWLFAQTTRHPDEFRRLCDTLKTRMQEGVSFEAYNTICRQVSGRQPHLERFARRHTTVIFVSGRKSSNGKVLFDACKGANPRSYAVEGPDELQPEWFAGCRSAGICGATSTPAWLMEEVAVRIADKFSGTV